jgi:hypothetical protein
MSCFGGCASVFRLRAFDRAHEFVFPATASEAGPEGERAARVKPE